MCRQHDGLITSFRQRTYFYALWGFFFSVADSPCQILICLRPIHFLIRSETTMYLLRETGWQGVGICSCSHFCKSYYLASRPGTWLRPIYILLRPAVRYYCQTQADILLLHTVGLGVWSGFDRTYYYDPGNIQS